MTIRFINLQILARILVAEAIARKTKKPKQNTP